MCRVPVISAAAVALASLLLIAFQVVNTADSVKAAASIACLAVLLVVASTYSIAAIFWNVYWRERSRRIEGESESPRLLSRVRKEKVDSCVGSTSSKGDRNQGG